MKSSGPDTIEQLLEKRIAIIDGAMGTMLQHCNLGEADYRGARFANFPRDLRGNYDVLSLTQPLVVEAIHRQYLSAGADIIETNTFSANAISMADYGMEDLIYDMNVSSARIARRAAEKAMAEDPNHSRFVAGSLGPTNKTASLPPKAQDPAFKAVTFGQLASAYHEQVCGLMDGGVDLLLAETVVDSLNVKAALFAIERYFADHGTRVPVIVSVTVSETGTLTLSGQTPEAFWNSISHIKLLGVGVNCGFGAREVRPFIEELSGLAPVYLSCYPNAGLPNAFGEYEQSPEELAAVLSEYAAKGWLNIVGGCCGTTPAHIRAIATAVRPFRPRIPAKPEPYAIQRP